MDERRDYRDLSFEQRSRTLPRRLISVCLMFVIFTVLWRFVPHNTLFWIVAPIFTILGWMATYSWRHALSTLINFLHRLERF